MSDVKVWAFKNPPSDCIQEIYESAKAGKSRFGWSWLDVHDLKKPRTDQHSRQQFLLRIKPGDWIVHINVPSYGQCVAAKVNGTYGFDEGKLGDFRHYIPVDPESVVEFGRNDPRLRQELYSGLRPRGRSQRVYQVDRFLESLNNLQGPIAQLSEGESAGEYHLKKDSGIYLKKIAEMMKSNFPRDKLEDFMVKVFENLPDAGEVIHNGAASGWKSDWGADIILRMRSSFNFIEPVIVVQVKSYEGQHFDTGFADQLKTGIEKFDGTAGLLISTADRTDEVDKALESISNEIGKPVDALCGAELARFVLKYAPNLIFDD